MEQETKKAKFIIMPPPPGTCQECAAKHDPRMPHNRDSLFYQYAFYGKYGSWPTWADAMAHCPDEVKEIWIDELTKRGVGIGSETKRAE